MFGVDWGDPPAALALVTVFSLVGIALGVLGGCMWPLAVVPEPVRVAGHLFPHAWAIDGFIDLIAEDAGLAGIVPQLAVLAGLAAVLLALAIRRLRRALLV